MLQLTDICKSYTTADFTQVALDHVSVAFRDNEFVAVLGPSGSGKTTMLNIVGGLDHYDSGDLIIDGISTKEYKDSDWDTYRNNRIGFVFQSYNLIPHQTILENVELALTLSGVGRAERRERAKRELERVGLGEHINKKPSQLSGGQMQRVAIARALINDPEILLADEPTGALDSKTSVQIMDLLTEIASDRLVVMVTHNPELAEQYATRIVTLADGVLKADTNPFYPGQEGTERREAKPSRRAHMSFTTALSLSFRNLLTKKGRTLMTAFAGSIGIIGIAAILALSNGVNNYIATVEENTLSEYPLSIESTGMDITSIMTQNMGTLADDGSSDSGGDGADGGSGDGADGGDNASSNTVREAKMVTNMFESIGSNDLASLKEYLDSGETDIDQYVQSIEYGYSVTPQIFASDTSDGVRQVNPDTSFSSLGLGSGGTNSIMSSMMSTDVFYQLPKDTSAAQAQYDVKAGHWPENYNEVVVVLTGNGYVSDFMLYEMGLKDHTELEDMVRAFANEEDITVPSSDATYTYDDLLGVEFKLVNATDYYEYDSEYKVWKDKSDDTDYMKTLVDEGETLKVVGVVQPKPDEDITSLNFGLYYPASLVDHLIDAASSTEIVQQQKDDPTMNVITGKSFAEEEEEGSNSGLDMSSLFTIDSEKLQSAFSIDQSALSADMSDLDLDLSNISIDTSSLPAFDASSISLDASSLNIDMSSLDLDMSGLSFDMSGIDMSGAVDTSGIAGAMSNVMGGFTSWFQQKVLDGTYGPTDYQKAMGDYMNSADVQAQLQKAIAGSFNTEYLQKQIASTLQTQLQSQLQAQLQSQLSQKLMPAITQAISSQLQTKMAGAMQSYMQTAMQSAMSSMQSQLQTKIQSAMQSYMSNLSSNMASAMKIDESAFADAIQMNMSTEDLSELMTSLMSTESSSYDGNMKKFGYADYAKPASIDIYPKDFESKQKVIDILDAYNQKMTDAGEDEKVVSYTDIVGALMSSVTTIVNMISYVLVAFVAISLVVSSIMIGVITYISVLERKKEIGILRSIGASKGDIGRVFNAETIIIGFTAGVIGIGLTALGCIPANIIVYQLFDVPNVAILPWQAAVVLVAISVFLTFLAGLIPSGSASRKDPVEALRSE